MRSLTRVGGLLLLVVTLGAIVLTGLLDSLNPIGPGDEPTYVGIMWLSSFIGFPIVGALIIWKLPSHRMGWILGGIGVSIALGAFLGEYATYALVTRPGSIPGGNFAAWMSTWLSTVTATLVLLLMIYFPRGAPRNVFWKRVTGFVCLAAFALGVMYLFRPGPLDAAPSVDNPLGIAGLRSVVGLPIGVIANLLVLVLLASIIDKFILFRKSTGIERQQLKWFALAGLSFPILFAVTLLLEGVLGRDRLAEFDPVVIAFMLGFNGLAVAVGLAVFKYHLYDVGTVVNRTLVYGALTAILGGAYVGSIFALQAILSPITAESDLVIAASTLAVAALFRPARSRVQRFIDARFYRKKIDRQRMVDDFSSDLRDEVELSAISSRLVSVTRESLQPAHVTLWLRSDVR